MYFHYLAGNPNRLELGFDVADLCKGWGGCGVVILGLLGSLASGRGLVLMLTSLRFLFVSLLQLFDSLSVPFSLQLFPRSIVIYIYSSSNCLNDSYYYLGRYLLSDLLSNLYLLYYGFYSSYLCRPVRLKSPR